MRLLLAFSLLAACTTTSSTDADDTGDSGDTVPAGENRLKLTFQIDDALVEQLDEGDSLVDGPFRGALWVADDTTDLGPKDGATSVAGISVATMTLSEDGDPTEVLWTSEPLDAGFYRVLGFFDSDGNLDPDDADPDDGDPVTLPSENEFEIVDGQDTVGGVYFGLLKP